MQTTTTTKMSKNRVIVRGSYRGVDTGFASAAESALANHFVVLDFDNEVLVNRRIVPVSQRSSIEEYTNDPSYRGAPLHVDMRDTGSNNLPLLPLKCGAHCQPVDFDQFYLVKTDFDVEALNRLRELTKDLLQVDNERDFRGATCKKHNYRSAFTKTESKGFTQYRGGFRDEAGHMVDLTHIKAKTSAWEERLERAYRGLDRVKEGLHAGVTVADCNRMLWNELDSRLDAVYGNAASHTGWEKMTLQKNADMFEKDNYVKLGFGLGAVDTGEVAIVYRDCIVVGDSSPDTFRGADNEPSGAVDEDEDIFANYEEEMEKMRKGK